jgi:hypothetical protein
MSKAGVDVSICCRAGFAVEAGAAIFALENR